MEPNILILSERFKDGDAITGLNLFSMWNKDNLYCASRCSDYFDSFKSFYLIGDKEVTFTSFFKLFNKVPRSGIINDNNICSIKKPQSKSLIGRIYLDVVVPILKIFGIFHKRVNYQASPVFIDWIDSLSLDYIYTSVGSLNMAQLIDQLMRIRPQIRYIIHGYDDWISPNYYSFFHSFEKDSSILLSSIINRASLTFATSDKMAIDYTSRYNRTFTTFPNPVNRISDSYSVGEGCMKITFVGKILNHNISSILALASALAQQNRDYSLHIYSDVRDNLKQRIKSTYNNTVFHEWINHEEIPNILRNSRILYLPISINEQTVKFTKYSMSTKMSEYLSSGVPILYQGPDGIAMTEMLEQYQCAVIVKNNNVENIKDSLNRMIQNASEMKEIVKRALILFNEKFDKAKVSNDFVQTILNDYENKK